MKNIEKSHIGEDVTLKYIEKCILEGKEIPFGVCFVYGGVERIKKKLSEEKRR